MRAPPLAPLTAATFVMGGFQTSPSVEAKRALRCTLKCKIACKRLCELFPAARERQEAGFTQLLTEKYVLQSVVVTQSVRPRRPFTKPRKKIQRGLSSLDSSSCPPSLTSRKQKGAVRHGRPPAFLSDSGPLSLSLSRANSE